MKANIFILHMVVVITILLADINKADKTPPKYDFSYSLSGIIKFPNAGVVEPFDSYYDYVFSRSRIDYYDGMTKTYQKLLDTTFGTSYKKVHVTTESVTNIVECFSVQGNYFNIILPQKLLPDLTNYNLVQENVTCGFKRCDKWGKFVNQSSIVSVLLFTVTLDGEPVTFTVDGSDNYVYEYFNYTIGTPNASLFEINKTDCHPLYGASAEDFHSHNPMKELIDGNDTHVHQMFEEFKGKHGKQYENDTTHEMRKMIFKQNVRHIHSVNRAGYSFKLAINQFADMTSDELMKRQGRLHTDKEHVGGILFNREKHLGNVAIPNSFDWRTKGAVTPVKDQATCGSCWSFGTTGTLEGAYYRRTGKLVSLSEQALVDCSWGFKNLGCDGGLDYQSYEWIKKHGGIPTNESYGPYLSEDGLCKLENVTKVAQIDVYARVPRNDINSLKFAIATYGPVSVSISVTSNFQFYFRGVFYDKDCGNFVYDLNHNVLAVGYGVEDGEPYWLIKNSWSTAWGDEGYIKMSQRDNNCGVATAATFVFLQDEVIPSTIFPPQPGASSIIQISNWILAICSIVTSSFIYTEAFAHH